MRDLLTAPSVLKGNVCQLAVVVTAAWMIAAGICPAARAAAFPTTGVQTLLVVPFERQHSPDMSTAVFQQPAPAPGATGPFCAQNGPSCPFHTAQDYSSLLQDQLNQYFGAVSYRQFAFRVRMLADPHTLDGWWPAPHTEQQYYANGDANWQPQPPPASGDTYSNDIATQILPQALAEGLITVNELQTIHRLAIIDNYQVTAGWGGIGGQARGISVPATLTVPINVFGFGRVSVPLTITESISSEVFDGGGLYSTLEHELGHQLGMYDLYTSGSNCGGFQEPGALAGGTGDCVGSWDHMSYDLPRLSQPGGKPNGLSAMSEILMDWIPPTAIKTIQASARQTVTLQPLNQSSSTTTDPQRPLVLRIPDSTFSAAGNANNQFAAPYRGLQAECRQQNGVDSGIPGAGALLTWIDTTRNGQTDTGKIEEVVRLQANQSVQNAWMSPGQDYANKTLGVDIRLNSIGADGSCQMSLNPLIRVRRPSIDPLIPRNFLTLAAQATSNAGQDTATFSGTGATIRTDAAPATTRTAAMTAMRSLAVPHPLQRLRVDFAFANDGNATAPASRAEVRITSPYAAVASCSGSLDPTGFLAGRPKLPRLGPGAVRTASVPFTAGFASSTGVTVRLPGARGIPAYESAATAVQDHPRSATPEWVSSTIRVSRPDGCRTAATYDASATAHVPAGWELQIPNARATIAPGHTANIQLLLKAPTNAAVGQIDIPIEITGGDAGLKLIGAADTEVDTVLGGIDLIAVTRRGPTLPHILTTPPLNLPRLPTRPVPLVALPVPLVGRPVPLVARPLLRGILG